MGVGPSQPWAVRPSICLPLHWQERPHELFHVLQRALDKLVLFFGEPDATQRRPPVRNDCFGGVPSRLRGDTNDRPHVGGTDVGGDASTGFPAHPSGGTFQSVASTTQHPCLRASCSVVATRVMWTATPADTRGGREGKPKAPKKEHSEEGRIHPGKTGGKHKKGTPASGPPCDLNNACSVGESLGLMVPSTRRPWTASVALRCHPWRRRPGSMSSSHCNSCQGAWNPAAARCSPAKWKVLSMQRVHDVNTNGGVPLLHHLQTVCPARPKSGSGEQCGASEAQEAKRQWQAGKIPKDVTKSHPQESAEASSERCVVVRCKTGYERRVLAQRGENSLQLGHSGTGCLLGLIWRQRLAGFR